MAVFSVSGRTAAAGGGADEAIAVLWNPSSTLQLIVYEVHLVRNGTAGGRPILARTTTRGTPGSTVTPDADNNWDSPEAPRSAVELNMAPFSAQPTLGNPRFQGGGLSTATGSTGVAESWLFPLGVRLAPSQGLAIITSAAVAFAASDVTYVWEESS